jgi:hypothetical protein
MISLAIHGLSTPTATSLVPNEASYKRVRWTDLPMEGGVFVTTKVGSEEWALA